MCRSIIALLRMPVVVSAADVYKLCFEATPVECVPQWTVTEYAFDT